jgi:hypothetical protein
MLFEPSLDMRFLVGAVIVHHQVKFLVARSPGVHLDTVVRLGR